MAGGAVVGVEQRSSLYRLLGWEDQVGWEPRFRWRISLRAVRRPGVRGTCRGEGLVAGEHVPDRFGESAGEVDLGDLGAALFAEPLFCVLVAVAVERVAAGVHGRLDQRPA